MNATVPIPALSSSDRERFWCKVRKAPGKACWVWTAATTVWGYGKLNVRGKFYSSSRIAWALKHGDPGSLNVLHECDNPACCRASHMFLGTIKDNSQDMIRKRRGHFNKGHALTHGINNGRSKLTPKKVATIRRLRLAGWSQPRLGKRFNVSHVAIGKIVRFEHWKAAA